MIGKTNAVKSGGGIDRDYVLYSNGFNFQNRTLPEKYKKMTVDLPSAQTSLANFFYRTVGCEELTINTEATITSFQAMLGPCAYASSPKLKVLTLNFSTANVSNWVNVISGDSNYPSALETITNPLDMTSAPVIARHVLNSAVLKDISFVTGTIHKSISLQYSPSLTLDSLASIVNGLADLTGETAQTLTLHATAKAKLTAEQIATITAKNWTLA